MKRWKRQIVSAWIISLVGIVLTLPMGVSGQSLDLYKKARKIELFKTTKKEINELLKGAEIREIDDKSGGVEEIHYDFEEGKLLIVYSTGKCVERCEKSGYDVRKDYVIGYYLDLFNPLKKSEVDIDFSKLTKTEYTEGNYVIYSNENDGIQITGGEEEVTSFEFSASAKQEKKYSCETSK